MLVLTRKKGEAIHIGQDIAVRVLSVQGNRVRLGIDAPQHVDVRRGEIIFDLELPSGTQADAHAGERTVGCEELACH